MDARHWLLVSRLANSPSRLVAVGGGMREGLLTVWTIEDEKDHDELKTSLTIL